MQFHKTLRKDNYIKRRINNQRAMALAIKIQEER